MFRYTASMWQMSFSYCTNNTYFLSVLNTWLVHFLFVSWIPLHHYSMRSGKMHSYYKIYYYKHHDCHIIPTTMTMTSSMPKIVRHYGIHFTGCSVVTWARVNFFVNSLMFCLPKRRFEINSDYLLKSFFSALLLQEHIRGMKVS